MTGVLNSIGDNDLIHFTVSAPGKLILFGEHSVVYGKSALAACINKRTYLKLSENSTDRNKITIRMKDINFEFSVDYKSVIGIINEDITGHDNSALKHSIADPTDINHDKFLCDIQKYISKYEVFSDQMSKQHQLSVTVLLYILHAVFYKDNFLDENRSLISPLAIDIYSELNVGAGAGSSASFCVCVAAALCYYKNVKKYGPVSARKITFDEKGLNFISKLAFCGEKILHGKPSGIDNTVATFGSFVEVLVEEDQVTKEWKRTFRNVRNPPKINVLLIDTGILRNTSKMIEIAARRKSECPTVIDSVLNGMHEISLKAIQIVNDMGNAQTIQSPVPDFSHLETLVDMNQGLLYSLGVSHERIQEICLICSRHELHAKLTGAGGGGYAFALVPTSLDCNKLEKCIGELESNGYMVHNTELGSDGVRIDE